MESEVFGKPIQVEKVKDQLRVWLDETSVNSACGIGIKNFTKESKLVNPQVYIAEGKVEYEPAEYVEPQTACACLFSKTQYALRGTSGIICYDIEKTGFMAVFHWYISVSESVAENRFNLRVMPRGECNDKLYDTLKENSHKANGEVIQEENGFRLCGCMNRESKALLIVDLYNSGKIGSLRTTEAIESGRLLQTRLIDLMRETTLKSVCGVGINNYTGHSLVSPKYYISHGRVLYEPPGVVDPQMGSPALFSKRNFSLNGTSGCLTYQIQGTSYQLNVLWYIPYSEALHDNRFFATVSLQTECDFGLYKQLWAESRSARDGDLIRTDYTFTTSAVMELSARALFIINLRTKKP